MHIMDMPLKKVVYRGGCNELWIYENGAFFMLIDSVPDRVHRGAEKE